MAISEKTKQVVSRQKSTLKQTFLANRKDIEEHEAIIASIKTRNVAIKAEYDSLDKDIPEPTPQPEGG